MPTGAELCPWATTALNCQHERWLGLATLGDSPQHSQYALTLSLNLSTIPIMRSRLIQRTPENAEPDSVFFREWLATNRMRNQLPISAVCSLNCIFCSNDQNPFAIERNIFRDLEDIKHQLSLMPVHDVPIRMSDSLPGRISEGEAFLHPRFFEILDVVRRKYPFNCLCFTTNASMIDEPFVRHLAKYRPLEINVSMHCLELSSWATIMGKSEREAIRAISSLALLRDNRITLDGTIVTTPRICGWKAIEETYSNFIAHGAREMTLYWPGHTVQTPSEVVDQISVPLEEFTDFGYRMRAKFDVPVSILPDMRKCLPVAVDTIMSHTLHGNPRNGWASHSEVLWLTSEAVADRIRGMVGDHAAEFSNTHRVFPVPNRTYGGNIIVSGLLMVDDFLDAGKEALRRWPHTDLVLIPDRPFDGLKRDLLMTPAHRLEDGLERTVWLVSPDGRIDHVLHRPLRKQTPAVGSLNTLLDGFARVLSNASRLEDALELFERLPAQTARGELGRDELVDALGDLQRTLVGARRQKNRHVEVLDGRHAVCREEWLEGKECSRLVVWLTLVSVGTGWKIRSVTWGTETTRPTG